MVAADIGSGRGDAFMSEVDGFHNLFLMERIFYSDRPGLPVFICAADLNIAPGIDIKIFEPFFAENGRDIIDRPTFHESGRIVFSVVSDVKKPAGFTPGFFGQSKYCFHVVAELDFCDQSLVDFRDFARLLVGAEFFIHVLEIGERLAERFFSRAGIVDLHGDGHAHHDACFSHLFLRLCEGGRQRLLECFACLRSPGNDINVSGLGCNRLAS